MFPFHLNALPVKTAPLVPQTHTCVCRKGRSFCNLSYFTKICLEDQRKNSKKPLLDNVFFVFTFCWPCISVYVSQYLTNLMHKICFTVSFISCLHVSSACVHHQEVKIALHSLWYHHTYRCHDARDCVMQFWPPDDKHMCSKHVEAWNKTYCETIFVLVKYWDKWRCMFPQKFILVNSWTKSNLSLGFPPSVSLY